MKRDLNMWRNVLLMVLLTIPLFSTCFFVFAEETIELEVGYEALEAYKTYQLEPGQYKSLDESVATVNPVGLVEAKHFGETVIEVYEEGLVVRQIPIIVYWVGDEPVPWGSAAVKKSFVTGYPGQTFKPKNYITRAEVATMFVNFMDLSYRVPKAFDDLTEAHWAYKYVESIVDAGLMAPRTETEFYPDALLTKSEFAMLLASYSNYQGFDISSTPRCDILDMTWSDEAYTAVHQMLNVQVLSLESGFFYPEDFIYRGDVVKIINDIIVNDKQFGEAVYFKDVLKDNPYYDIVYRAF